ncbi:peptidoglycan-binding protein LysM [Lactobacillus sp. PFC-70]|uniref:LysM domain-containing protein n=1 Tax=Levilactobacillus namurensis TaxID=380393 RepID=A0AAW8W214_9LACO|nr:LysM domain-containing protein [Levilactobacillus namurensis]MDT7013517.1 LysM domain-containing protein [Levilactobacillus namurensis]PTM22145.1 peptidoglycan-binding protein LysM [Lactobacillus sp. PFC-70]
MGFKKALVMTLGAVAVAGAGLFTSNEQASAATRVTVKQGDSVWALANQYDSSVKAIEKANHLTNSSLIFVGENLTIPAKHATATTHAAGVTQHTYRHTSNQAPSATTTTQTTQTQTTTQPAASGVSGSEASAKNWIAYRESRGSYTATNGQYIGKYQLSSAYLKGDYSAANQEKVANQYVAGRYGSWTAAQAFWQANGWY